MAAQPETRYATSDAGYVAYQVFGEGPISTLFITSWAQNLDVMWDEPGLARYMGRLASFSRVVCFDKRGSGVSDPVPWNTSPALEEWMDDARVVLDAAGVDQTAVIGDVEGGPMAILFAATYPERVSALVLINTFARWRRDSDYPIGMPDDSVEKLTQAYEDHWGVDADILQVTAPTAARDPRFRDWYRRYQRLAMPRGAATEGYRWVTNLDVRMALPAIQAPTLVVNRSDALHHRPTFSVRRLAAVDMWGSQGSLLRRRLILIEFLAGALGGIGLGLLTLLTAAGGIWIAVGVWLVGAGVNYLPLAVQRAVSLSRG